MGSGSDPHRSLATDVGRLVARLGAHLLTGGGQGVMESVGRAFCQTAGRRGVSIGILKGRSTVEGTSAQHLRADKETAGPGRPVSHLRFRPLPPNPWVEIPIYTHLPLSGAQGRSRQSRNHINVLSADVLVALPGGKGTFSEVVLRIEYGKRVILYLGGKTIDGRRAEELQALVRPKNQDCKEEQISVADSCVELEAFLRRQLGQHTQLP
jgi:predicted Rossmann-fold nucleotide-binding protein